MSVFRWTNPNGGGFYEPLPSGSEKKQKRPRGSPGFRTRLHHNRVGMRALHAGATSGAVRRAITVAAEANGWLAGLRGSTAV
jgi:hypothetical protein